MDYTALAELLFPAPKRVEIHDEAGRPAEFMDDLAAVMHLVVVVPCFAAHLLLHVFQKREQEFSFKRIADAEFKVVFPEQDRRHVASPWGG